MRRIAVSFFFLSAALVAAWQCSAQIIGSGIYGDVRPVGGGGSLTWNVPGSGNTATFTGTPTLPYTTSALSIGTASSDRVVVVLVSWRGTTDITNVQIGASSATQAVDMFGTSTGRSGGGDHNSTIWYLNIPSGTAASITISGTSGLINDGVISIAYLTGSARASVASTQNACPPCYYTNADLASPSASISLTTGQVAVIAGLGSVGGSNSSSWTGTSSSTPDEELNDGTIIGTMQYATASGTVTGAYGNGGVAGWVSATFKP
jgi:hypothetical protein